MTPNHDPDCPYLLDADDTCECSDHEAMEGTMAKWWAARISVTELRYELRRMVEDGERADDARDALAHLRGKRGSLNYIDATVGLGPHVAVKAVLADAGAAILTEDT